VVVAGVASCSSGDDDTGGAGDGDAAVSAPSPTAAPLPGDDLRLNEVQVLGSHNSYHLRARSEVADALSALVADFWAEIDYEHVPIPEQLEDHGIRQIELDVLADPDGGLYSSPAALELLGLPAPGDPELAEPGFKVQHVADIDHRSSCITFVECLEQVEQWSSAHPSHLPLMVMVETKGDDVGSGAGDFGIDLDTLGVEFASPPSMTAALYEDLEAEVLSVFDRDRIVTPDDVRGSREDLEEAVLEDGWPTVGETRGKVLLSLVDTGAARDTYLEDAPALEGRLFFTSSEPGRPDAAFLRIDDPIADAGALADAAGAGYLIRTRTDVPGVHAPAGDTSMREAAFASGANHLSTDYYLPHPGSGYVVALPGGGIARCNPVSAPADCEDSEITED
jgi:hypothetical protein